MGCVKLHILDQQYKQTELKVSYINKELTLNCCAQNQRKETLLNYAHARSQDVNLGFISTDPMWIDYPWISSYHYCANNPIRLIDPSGKHIEVTANDDGTYKITGGTQNKDKSIYIMKDGKRTGEVLGQTLTEYSFFNDAGKVVKDAVINPNDKSGNNFMYNITMFTPEIGDYMDNAKGGEKYDFKRTNGTDKNAYGDDEKMHYRGMPIGKDGKQTVYASARDVGNIGAGYMAGLYAIPWSMARKEFDKLESQQQGHPAVEGMATQSAQRIGWERGMAIGNSCITYRLTYQIMSIPTVVKRLFK